MSKDKRESSKHAQSQELSGKPHPQKRGRSIAYAAVYPLTMLLRIMAAQTLAVILCG